MKQNIINFGFLASGTVAVASLVLACILTSVWFVAPALIGAYVCDSLTEKTTIGKEEA